jgi:molybdopterin-guanine dinucleotide biosynthesis adapter protein
MHKAIPILGFVASKSNAGKTTLITKLIETFAKRNIRVSVVKHAHHQFDIDHKGKDSYKIREAGAVQTLIASSERWALMTEMSRTPDAAIEADLTALLAQLNTNYADIIFVEGFKRETIAKIEIIDAKENHTPIAETDPQVIAIVSDIPIAIQMPQFKRDASDEIADFIQATFLKNLTF